VALVSPLVLVLVPSFIAPIFGGGELPRAAGSVECRPFIADNYRDVFSSSVTLQQYGKSLKFAAIVWALSLMIGFNVSYFLVFHVRNQLLAIGLFLLCTVPFWTSNIIRMISWIPLLGKNGLVNSILLSTGVIHQPLEFLLFSDFAVVVAYVHQLTIFMIVPIFNAMSRLDKRTVEAALDAERVASKSCATSSFR
jgi:putative spermidine/putrescine transport system permease protein